MIALLVGLRRELAQVAALSLVRIVSALAGLRSATLPVNPSPCMDSRPMQSRHVGRTQSHTHSLCGAVGLRSEKTCYRDALGKAGAANANGALCAVVPGSICSASTRSPAHRASKRLSRLPILGNGNVKPSGTGGSAGWANASEPLVQWIAAMAVPRIAAFKAFSRLDSARRGRQSTVRPTTWR